MGDMKYVAGVDIGNATTEVALAKIDGQDIEFLTSGIGPTTGIKGTLQNISGVFMSLKNALEKAGMDYSDLAEIRINEAAPVIGDVAMETISETVITESTVIGHNPSTPGGTGIGVGTSVLVTELSKIREAKDVIVIVPNKVGFAQAAALMNQAKENIHITGAIVQADDGVLLNNRLDKKIPIIDEVAMIEKVPLGMTCAIEVAQQGTVLSTLSNPYGIATVFDLTSEETKRVVPIARSLIGARSGVVIKTPTGDVQERSIKAGTINIIGLKKEVDVDVDEGADKIMEAISSIQEIDDIQGETGTNAGNMLNKVRRVMAGLTNKSPQDIKIQDLLAVDTFNPQKVVGGIADEFALENAVGIAAMVKSDRLQMEMIAQVLTEKLRVPVYVGGVEADMAIKGALTTPGTSVPLAIVDMGAGSTDASIINREGKVKLIHLAGAGNMVSLLIQSELGLDDFELAEDVKKYTLAKVESLFHIRHENGTVQFFDKPLDPSIFAKVVLVKENDELVPLDGVESLEKVKAVRMEAKKKVFVTNAIRSLSKVSPTGNPRDIQFVVMVGGSALDFEIPNFVTDALADYEIVAGRGNIRGCEGPRNAVAAMVKSDRLQMEMIAQVLTEKLRVPVYVGGVEADMAIKGALTTPGTSVPLAIVDMGAGSTDASIINREGKVKLIHLAGAGNMVSLLIQSELGLDDFELAEDVKKYTLAKVESLFHIRHENGTVQFFDKPLDPSIFAKVVLVKENDELVPLDGVESLEKVKAVRMEAKKKVFVTNAIRSLSKVSPTGNPRDIQFVVMVGGSALDFEIPNFVTDALADYEIVAGRGNIRGCEGPRNAVATGLAMACVEQEN